MSIKNDVDKKKDPSSEKKENINEHFDNMFTLGIFSFLKYNEKAKTDPKTAYMRIFIPLILGITFFFLFYLLYSYFN